MTTMWVKCDTEEDNLRPGEGDLAVMPVDMTSLTLLLRLLLVSVELEACFLCILLPDVVGDCLVGVKRWSADL